jgi:hypothetical protein
MTQMDHARQASGIRRTCGFHKQDWRAASPRAGVKELHWSLERERPSVHVVDRLAVISPAPPNVRDLRVGDSRLPACAYWPVVASSAIPRSTSLHPVSA